MSSNEDIIGTGILAVEGRKIGPCSFNLTFVEGAGGFGNFEGTVTADPVHIREAFNARGCTIVRDDTGFKMRAIITRNDRSGTADVTISGLTE